jgi:catechol 2,3-dioxygenase
MSSTLTDTRMPNSVSGITSAGAPLRIGTVALTVRDLQKMSRFYQQVIGLTSIERGAGIERLGVGETILLELRHDPAAPLADRRAPGLFHLALLLPSRADLGQWLRQAAEKRILGTMIVPARVSTFTSATCPQASHLAITVCTPI